MERLVPTVARRRAGGSHMSRTTQSSRNPHSAGKSAQPAKPTNEAVGTEGSEPGYGTGVADRRVVDRRSGPDAGSTGLERRRGPGRRRTDFTRAAEEGEMTGEQFLFLMAIDVFKRVNNKTFPSWSDVLEIVRRLGYRKVQASEISVPQAEDWTESPSAPLWPQVSAGPEAEDDFGGYGDAA